MNILILGISGMIGHILYRHLALKTDWNIYGTLRSKSKLKFFKNNNLKNIFIYNIKDQNQIQKIFKFIKPSLVINCIGLVKQNKSLKNISETIFTNSLYPNLLSKICNDYNIRLIHFSTDCVFSGQVGQYSETSIPDASDLYGRTKFLGELHSSKTLTIRTSFIGHQLSEKYALLEWFLKQNNKCKGFYNAIYSGLPTIEISEIMMNYIIPNNNISGLFHVSSEPITKFKLLNLIKNTYNHNIEIIKDEKVHINRSLLSNKFKTLTNYECPSWDIMIKKMFKYRKLSYV